MKNINKRVYGYWFALPGVLVYILIFAIPTFLSFYFALTRWDLKDAVFIGLDNFKTFLTQPNLKTALINTLIYAFATSLSKVVFGMLIAVGLCSGIRSAGYLKSVLFFPNLLGNVAVGLAFTSLMHPSTGLINTVITALGGEKVYWLTDKNLALFSVILVDIWKGIGVSVILYIAGIKAIPESFYEAAVIDGATGMQRFKHITLPLCVSSINSVLTLSLIGGLRTYELIWTMTEGGPGYASEVLGSVVYKLFANGQYGLSTSGNVILFVIIAVIIFPINGFISRKEAEL